MTDPLVEMRGITVDFPGVRAIDGVDLTLFAGEVHALMGENGAGKSTIIGALTGTYPLYAGEIRIGGSPGSPSGVADARAAGIATVFQEAHLSPKLSVTENIMLGAEVRGRIGIDWRATRARATEVLTHLGLDELDPRARLASLSPAEKQLVAIARALVLKPRVLVLDEPTSSLDAADVRTVLGVVRRLRREGVAILFVSHFIEHVFAIADRLTVLRGGRVVAEYDATEVERAEVISRMIGEDIEALREIRSDRLAHHYSAGGRPTLQADGIGRRGVMSPTNLELSRGEVVGFAGLRGSGRTELARLVGGSMHADSGHLWIDGERVRLRGPGSALHRRIAVSPENLRDGGIIGGLTARENVVLALQAMRGWSRPLSRGEQAALLDTYLDALHIDPADLDRPVESLSGGTQQKMLLARLLATRPHVLILDEPTRGIDISTKVEIQRHIAKLAGDGVAVAFISSELEEVVRLSDRIVVLKDREKIGELMGGPGVTVDTIIEMIAAGPGIDLD